jgi:hypothetical protein
MEFTGIKTLFSILTDSSIFGFGVKRDSEPKNSKSGSQEKKDVRKSKAQANKDREELKQKRSSKEKTKNKQKSMF